MAGNVLDALVTFEVTPRFDIFYALRALQQRSADVAEWATQIRAGLSAKFDTAVRRVAPRPIMWALLADTLRDAKSDPTFDEIVHAIGSLRNEDFQRAILGGVFRASGVVDDIISGQVSLHDAVQTENKTGNPLLSVLGLEPFERSKVVATVFTRIVSKPAEYRADLSRALEQFWQSGFNATWRSLEPRMTRRAATMQEDHATRSLASFARDERLPVVFDDDKRIVMSARGSELFPYKSVQAIHVIPSAFNDARFWGAYQDASESVVLYFPVFDSGLLRAAATVQMPESSTVHRPVDPAIGFRALGDTTRYAMASVLAKTPKTSAELAREFSVSKATISHHIQMLRRASLLIESTTDRGVVLALDRAALESLSGAAANEMFARQNPPIIRRSRHERAAQKRKKEAGEKAHAPTGQRE